MMEKLRIKLNVLYNEDYLNPVPFQN